MFTPGHYLGFEHVFLYKNSVQDKKNLPFPVQVSPFSSIGVFYF